ncbi:MAG: hypothetical protein JST85_23840 [Acidobacteria bacterium]|nr:hypothetical protein [Acidobacteriota bacterium]
MRKLDRLGWAAGLTVQTYGLRIGLRTNKPEALEQLTAILPPGWKVARGQTVGRIFSLFVGGPGPRPGQRKFHLAYSDFDRIARSHELSDVVETLASEIQLYVAEYAKRRVFIHAGVVGWRGQAIIIPGSSMSGKSTLVEELVRAGAEYYSDEYAVLDETGRVHPFPKSPQRRDPETYRQTEFSVESVGGRLGTRPLPVGKVILSQYEPEAIWQPRSLTAGRGVLALLAHTVSARSAPERALPALTQLVHKAKILKGSRGEAQQLIEALLET